MKTIFTINGYFNYGNRLQLFALAKILRSFGGKVNVYRPFDFGRYLKELLKYSILLRRKYKKEYKLRKFTQKNALMGTSRRKTEYSVVGSDQVWNPKWYSDQYYLFDVPNDSKKISYAASVGAQHLTDAEKEIFRKALSGYDYISVREKAAKIILEPLTDKKIEVVLDPTLLLGADEYVKMEKKPENLDDSERYILCYILGDREMVRSIMKYAEERRFKVILFSDRKESDYGIEEFLYLIHHAELICTDSFHACVFSFIFDRPFVAFRRAGGEDYMYSRLENLIETFHLKNREYDGKGISEKNLVADYAEGKRILEKERKRSIEWLKNALETSGEQK